jgi:DNA-binding MarR family transcriptional regulator
LPNWSATPRPRLTSPCRPSRRGCTGGKSPRCRLALLRPRRTARRSTSIADYFIHAAAQQQFAGLPIAGIREFSVLALTSNDQTPTKSEIAADAQLELSTVTEVTRRLVQAGLVREVADPKDRRARRLQITPAGQAVYAQSRARLEEVSQHLYDPLAAPEQTELHRLLSILNTVHSAAPAAGSATGH